MLLNRGYIKGHGITNPKSTGGYFSTHFNLQRIFVKVKLFLLII